MQHLWQGNHMTLRDPRNRQASSKMDPKDIRLFVFLRRIWWQSVEGTSGSSSQPHAPRSKTNILAIQLAFLLLDHNLNYPIYSNLHSATQLMSHATWHMTHYPVLRYHASISLYRPMPDSTPELSVSSMFHLLFPALCWWPSQSQGRDWTASSQKPLSKTL